MSALNAALDDYLKLRRALGFKFKDPEIRLRRFVSFMEERQATLISTQLALEWARLPNSHPSNWATRLRMVRAFARHCRQFDERHEVPPAGLLTGQPARATPYLYTITEIKALMNAALALSLQPRTALRGLTYHCLIGLLSVTGLRRGEAFALKREDVDLEVGVLWIRQTKFGKSRLVPLHASTCRALKRYARQRDAHLGAARSPYFLVAERGGRLWKQSVYPDFYRLSRQVGLRGPGARSGPRFHDFRHRFAVETLLNWCRRGEDIEHHLPTLSTFLGHTYVEDTYWYLSASPELLRFAARRLATRWGPRP